MDSTTHRESEEVIMGNYWLYMLLLVGAFAVGSWWYYGDSGPVAQDEASLLAATTPLAGSDPQTRDLRRAGTSDEISAIETDLARSHYDGLDRELSRIEQILGE